MKLQTWAIGVIAAVRREVTLPRTLASIEAAGFPRPRIFADGEVSVPTGYAITRHEPAVGGWPNFWLTATELVSREPAVDAYLIIQDDVVFCAGVFDYVRRFDVPDDCGVLSLFCPACYNKGLGWFAVPVGYGVAGAQALVFPRERMYQFLSSSWTVNHRRAAPASEHYCGDGLHHIDGVVGEWCRREGIQCYYHGPSLSQHIGYSSAMYPGFEGKKDRRFADSFPGVQVNANEVFVAFHRAMRQWQRHGGNEDWSISAALWSRIYGDLRLGMRTLETGSGLSTKMFLDAGCNHTSLEHDHAWASILTTAFPACETPLCLRDLTGDPPWYDWSPDGPFDLILIDGPPAQIGRRGVLRMLEHLVQEQSIIYVDDARRPEEAGLCEMIQRRLGWEAELSTAGHHGFARITRA